jgi:hypothetical protein
MLTAASVVGCGKTPVQDEHTVSWYVDHKPERVAAQRWCADDTARQATPNCMNAEQAAQQIMMRPNAKSTAEGFQFQ